MDIDEKPWKCKSCEWIGPLKAWLCAENPFDKTQSIYGCPTCFAVDQAEEVCEIEGCEREAHCGGTFNDGVYRRTCSQHAEWLKKEYRAV